MKSLLLFIQKEFRHILRDRKTLIILFGLPITQVLIYGFALTTEVKNAKLLIVDQARDLYSGMLISRLDASRYFEVVHVSDHTAAASDAFRKGAAKMAVVFPSGFTQNLDHKNSVQLQFITDGSDPNMAAATGNYAAQVVRDFQQELNAGRQAPHQINVVPKMLYNPQLRDAPNFIPGVMALVLMLLCVMMTSIAIVKEKETGTMEMLLASSFSPMEIILAKTLPYLALSMINLALILLLSFYLLDLPVKGSLLLLIFESILFILSSLALGILISILTDSQQVAMLVSLIGLLIPALLLSGFMFPIENMPLPLQWMANLIPAKWYCTIVQSVMIKGLGIASIWKESLVLLGMTALFTGLSLRNFKVRLS